MEYIGQDSDQSEDLEDNELLETNTRSIVSRREREPVLSGEDDDDYDVYRTNDPPKKYSPKGKKHKRMNSSSNSWSGMPSRRRGSKYHTIDHTNKPRKGTLFGVGLLICCLILVGIAIIVLWRLDFLHFIQGGDDDIGALPLISAHPTSSLLFNLSRSFTFPHPFKSLIFDCDYPISGTNVLSEHYPFKDPIMATHDRSLNGSDD